MVTKPIKAPPPLRTQEHPLTKIALLGEFNPDFPPHPATNVAILHSCKHLGAEVQGAWLSTEHARVETLKDLAGIWVAPGSPYKNLNNTLAAIHYARENALPCFGTCGGFQHIVLEYARNVLGYKDAQHAEYDPYASNLFISSLACSLAGKEMSLDFVAGSKIAEIYGALHATEHYYCNFGVNPDVVPLFKNGPLQIVGSDSEGKIRILELPNHPFFVATLFVPQARSQPDRPHPLVTAFLNAVVSQAATLPHPRRAATR
jgi:CTP synthase (UTP-ammonia lyase)